MAKHGSAGTFYEELGVTLDELGDIRRGYDRAFDKTNLDEYEWNLLQLVKTYIENTEKSIHVLRNSLYTPRPERRK